VDLTKMSREQYVDYAISKGLMIEDNQLRMPTKLRAATSLAEYDALRAGVRPKDVRANPELKKADDRFSMFVQNMKNRSGMDLEEGIRVRSGTKDSSTWLFWKINEGAMPNPSKPDPAFKVEKAYLGFDNPFTSLTPERMQQFLRVLKEKGYNGDVKTAQDLGEATHMSDQIVMHGRTIQDAELGMKIGQEFFKGDLNFFERGYDSASQSYSQILQSKIYKALGHP
jgi:hypothetical protein